MTVLGLLLQCVGTIISQVSAQKSKRKKKSHGDFSDSSVQVEPNGVRKYECEEAMVCAQKSKRKKKSHGDFSDSSVEVELCGNNRARKYECEEAMFIPFQEKINKLEYLLQHGIKMKDELMNKYSAVNDRLDRTLQDFDKMVEIKQSLEKENNELRKERQDADRQMKEIQGQLERERLFSRRYESQVQELREQCEQQTSIFKELKQRLLYLQEVSNTLKLQLGTTVIKTRTEHLACSIAEEKYSPSEKVKIMQELEVKEMMANYQQELAEKDATIASLVKAKRRLFSDVANCAKEREALNNKCKELQERVAQLNEKKSGKVKSVRVGSDNSRIRGPSEAAVGYGFPASRWRSGRGVLRIREVCPSSACSSSPRRLLPAPETRLDGGLSPPDRKTRKKFGWVKKYVVASSKKILLYENEQDQERSNPYLVLDTDKLFHVGPVTRTDVSGADSKDIPRIFQILYDNEGERMGKKEEIIAPCKAKNLILLAPSTEEQRKWVSRLGEKIPPTSDPLARSSPRTSTKVQPNQPPKRPHKQPPPNTKGGFTPS